MKECKCNVHTNITQTYGLKYKIRIIYLFHIENMTTAHDGLCRYLVNVEQN